MAKYEHLVTIEEQGLTVNRIIKENYKFSQRFRTKMKFQHLVDLNGEPVPGYIKPEAGDIIGVRLPEEENSFEPQDIPVTVLYEDEDLLIVDKQPGITTHPTKGHPNNTLANGVMKYILDNDLSFKIRFANRLDMDTSGVIVIAKNANTQNDITRQMKANMTVKKYFALVHGELEDDEFTIDLPVGRPIDGNVQRAVMPVSEGGKDAVTDVRLLESINGFSLIELTIHTGRTHQIRVHMSHIGHPIVGDHLYGGQAPDLIDRQALHAGYMMLYTPMTGEAIEISAPIPEDISNCIEKIKKIR